MTTRARYNGGLLEYYESLTHERFPVGAPVVFIDDFLGAGVAVPAAASAESGVPWVKKIVGNATLAIAADSTNGELSCALDATSEKQNAEAYFNDELQFHVQQGLVFEARFKASVLPTGNAEMVIGLISNWADGLDNATYSVFATLDGSGEIICEKDDNASDESTTSGVTLTNAEYAIVRIDCTDYADIKFYVNGSRVAESNTFDWAASSANSKVQPVVGCYKASGTGVGTLLVDYVKVWQKRS